MPEKKFYRVDCWIEIPHDEDEIVETFTSIEDATSELDHYEGMQPKNRYEVVECKEDGSDLD